MLQIGNWIEIKDGDPRAVGIYRRHYSCEHPEADLVRYGFSGNGESMMLLSPDCLALWCWRRVVGEGIDCSVFHNESSRLSSELIKEADRLAWSRWDEPRHYTYVNPSKIRSTNPGYCYLRAGWHKCGMSKGGLIILEIFRVGYEG